MAAINPLIDYRINNAQWHSFMRHSNCCLLPFTSSNGQINECIYAYGLCKYIIYKVCSLRKACFKHSMNQSNVNELD